MKNINWFSNFVVFSTKPFRNNFLVDGLENLRLVDLAMNKLNDENEVVRYWAVHSITNPGITKQLNSTNAADLKLARNIIGRLTGLVDNGAPEIVPDAPPNTIDGVEASPQSSAPQ